MAGLQVSRLQEGRAHDFVLYYEHRKIIMINKKLEEAAQKEAWDNFDGDDYAYRGFIAGAKWREENPKPEHEESLLKEGYRSGFIEGMDFSDAMEAHELHPDCDPNIDECFKDFLKSRRTNDTIR